MLIHQHLWEVIALNGRFERFEAFVGAAAHFSRCIQKLKSAEMAAVGLKANQTMSLFTLRRNEEGLTAAELSASSGEDKAAVSRAIAELTELGYVSRSSPDGARYRAKLTLTEKGREAADYIDRRVKEIVTDGGDGLTDGEREVFHRALVLISENLTAMCEAADRRAGSPAINLNVNGEL